MPMAAYGAAVGSAEWQSLMAVRGAGHHGSGHGSGHGARRAGHGTLTPAASPPSSISVSR